MARDPFKDMPRNINEGARGAFEITPNDGADLASTIRAITIGTAAGTLSWVDGDGATWTTGPLPLGTYSLRNCHRVRATGTTATGLTGWV